MSVAVVWRVEMENGVVWRHHVDHLKPLQESTSPGSVAAGQAQPDGATEDEEYLPFAGNAAAACPKPPAPHGQSPPPPRHYPRRDHTQPTRYGCVVSH